MLVTTRSRARRRYLLRRWGRRARGLVGGLLVVVAGFAFWVALLGGVLAAGAVLDEGSGLDPALRPQVLTAWSWVAAVGLSAWFAARTFRAVPRRMVLWLRRFRHADSIRAVSTALDHLGHSWRVVTLDDRTAQASGVAPGLRLTTSAASAVGGVVRVVTGRLSAWGPWIVRAYLAAWVGLVGWTIWEGRPWAVLEALGGDWTQWPVPGEVALARGLAGAGLLVFAALLALVPLVLLALLLMPGFMLAGSVGEGVRRAERAKRQRVATRSELLQVRGAVLSAAGAALGPRLTVVSVDSAIWREAVQEFARSCHAVLLDVSTASEALLWEVRELGGGGGRVVFVGEEGAVTRLLAAADRDLTPEEVGLRDALRGCEVITYRTTLMGRVRFQRALYGALEATAPLRLSTGRARRWALTVPAVAVVVVGLWQVVAIVTSWPWERLVGEG